MSAPDERSYPVTSREHPSQAEHDHGAESRVANNTDDHLAPACHHLLDLHPDDLRVGLIIPGIGRDRPIGLPDLPRIAQAQLDTTRFGFVQDVGRDDLQGDWEADVPGQAHGLID